jgi:uncharacterized protein
MVKALRRRSVSLARVCVGIDLAGLERNPTGVAVLRAGRLERLDSVSTDEDILAVAALAVASDGAVAVNAPLTLPLGRCCLDDDCRCRHEPGVRSRQFERDLRRLGIPILATALIKILARRGLRLAAALRAAGCEPLETYPFATLRLLGLPTAGKRTELGRRRIQAALQELVPGLDHPQASEHELDAVACALTAQLWLSGRTRAVGLPEEGLMIVPDARAREELSPPADSHAAAELPRSWST